MVIMTLATLGLMLAMALMLTRALQGPTLYDRVLAINTFGTKTILFLLVFCFLIDRPDGVDIALLYALINFVSTIAILKFFRYRSLNVALARTDHGHESGETGR
ncbi:MAG: monovalent cation/H+ antiporter complex subunit F [Maricaulaceae bacterium]